MSKKIVRSTDGVADFCISQADDIKDREDLDIDKKTKHVLAYLSMAMQYTKLNLENKKLLLKAPEIAKNRALVLQLGPPQLEQVEPVEDEEEETPPRKAAKK